MDLVASVGCDPHTVATLLKLWFRLFYTISLVFLHFAENYQNRYLLLIWLIIFILLLLFFPHSR